jgi:N-acetylglucosamine-6-sulfatase
MASATGTRTADARSSRPGRPLLIVVALVFVLSSAVLLASSPWSNVHRPNVVLIVTDDQRWDTLDAMPAVKRLLVDDGVTFENAFTTTPSCCPSRVGLLTGEYSHDTGVLDGSVGNAPGGAPAFEDDSSLATWLDDAGYRTGLFGKYLNDYAALPRGYIPPGWDQWFAIAQPPPQIRYYDYELNENGTIVRYGDAPSDYSTTVLEGHAVSFVSEEQPFFLYFAPIAPHPPSLPAPQDAGAHVDTSWEAPPSFAEDDVSDKPGAGAGPLDLEDARGIREDMLRSLLAVDRAVEAIADAVEDAGLSNDTYFLFTSDNGYLWGEHRLLGKVWPYEESIRVPLVIRPPGGHTARSVDALVLNIDVAPTIADLAGVDPPLPHDGRSLMPLLDRHTGAWRDRFVVEFLGYAPGIPPYSGIRTNRYLYVEYENGWRELYDVRADPFELRNMLGEGRGGPPGGVVGRLRKAMEDIIEG